MSPPKRTTGTTPQGHTRAPPARDPPEAMAPGPAPAHALQRLQAQVRNRGMRQLLREGLPLLVSLRAEHERSFGVDLGAVRLHDHADAHRLAQAQQAQAFTLGRDIVFNDGF